MASYSRKVRRSPHNFGRGQSSSPLKPIPKINRSNRLVRKYKNPGLRSRFSEKRIWDDAHPPGEAAAARDKPSEKSGFDKHTALPMEHKYKNDRSSGEVSIVPNPVPDTGFRPTPQAQGPEYPAAVTALPGSSVRATPTTFQSALALPVFSALPPLPSLSPTATIKMTPSRTTTAFSSAYSGPDRSNNVEHASEMHQGPQTHRLSTPIIVLLAVGAGLLLAGLFIMIKICSRPVRRPRPTPSLPILDDPFSDDSRFQTKDSPIFGGKERLSPLPGSNSGLWAWTQYPHPGPTTPKPAQAASYGKIPGDSSYGYGAVSRSPRLQGKGLSGKAQYHFTGHAHTQSAPTVTSADSPHQPPFLQVQSALTRAASRLSATSMSVYVDSPRLTQSGVGIAIGGSGPGTAFTADGHQVIKRTKSKASLERSRRNSGNDTKELDPVHSRYSQGIAYDGADVSSPTFTSHAVPQVIPTTSRGGRTRIKSSYYAPGSYPRMSNVHSFASKDANSASEPYRRPSIQKSESRRDRDTQALTYALGLSSPVTDYVPPSPQLTLYPDDSLSVVDARRPRKRSHKKPPVTNETGPETDFTGEGRLLPTMTPGMDASAALGNLMLMDFGAANQSKRDSEQMSKGVEAGRMPKRNDDKPPHIPLPPPLPSLAQMGLEHANPHGYADYKSPTYSIYGLYESGRKSGFGY